MALKRWTTEEDSALFCNYSELSSKSISLIIGRSKRAVERRAHRLGIANKTPNIDLNFVKQEFLKVGYLVLSDEYINSYTKIRFKCARGHKSEISWNKFQMGRRCLHCYYDPGDMYDKIVNAFDAAGYKLLLLREEYKDSKQKLPFICPNGHHHSITWNSFGQGSRCSRCSPNVSGAEKEISSFIKSLGFEVVENTVGILNGLLEIDIYIPSKKVAIEYCGLRWHGENFSGRGRNYHYSKYKECLEKGIRLITVFEDEYLEHPLTVLSRIKSALGAISIVVYARNTEFKEITLEEARSFLNKYHIQGYSPCKYRFGLFKGVDLIQVMTFGNTSRNHAGGKGVIELKRLAATHNIVVVGGASKLFKGSLRIFGEQYSTVKSYCDMRWASIFTTVYDKLGFTLVGSTKYTPHYIKRQKRYRNYTLRKTAEERKLGLTEWELRRNQGYDRIWDCGHRTYLFKIKERC